SRPLRVRRRAGRPQGLVLEDRRDVAERQHRGATDRSVGRYPGAMTDDPAVGLDRDGAVAVLRLQRPARYNALTLELKNGLLARLGELGRAEDVRALLLTVSGRAFCVGQDLGEHAQALQRDPATAFA